MQLKKKAVDIWLQSHIYRGDTYDIWIRTSQKNKIINQYLKY